MKEIRWHGRGGQGAVVAARLLAASFVTEGKSATAFPRFGFERRGAPVTAFTRFDDTPVRQKTQIYYPDCVIVLDQRLMRSVDVFEGIKEGAVAIINTTETQPERYHKNLLTIGAVDAIKIGLEEIGRPITNSAMLGAFARATGWVKLDSILANLEDYFSGIVLKKNLRCIQRGYEETKVVTF